MKIETICKGCVFEANCDGKFMKDAQCWRRLKPLDIPDIKHDDPYETHKQIKHCTVCKSDDRIICNDLRTYGFSPSPYEPEECSCPCHEPIDFDDECDCYECMDRKIV